MQDSYFQRSNISLRDKFISLDYSLIILVLILGIISFFSMYSTERGNFDYYTTRHVYRFCIFFVLFIGSSFLNIKFWHRSSYLFYLIILILLIGVDFFGITASGSKRWIHLFFISGLANGAAPELPLPPCSTSTTKAYLGFSNGAKAVNKA